MCGLISLCLSLLVFTEPALAAGFFGRWRKKPPTQCEEILGPQAVPLLLGSDSQTSEDAMRVLEDKIPALLSAWRPPEGDPAWVESFYSYLWPSESTHSAQLSVAIVGPANVGKSTVFNALPRLYRMSKGEEDSSPDAQLSPSGPEAALTVQPRFLLQHGAYADGVRFKERFGPVDQWSADDPPLGTDWSSLVHQADDFFPNLVFVDTPGFDIHTLNPMAARAALLSDVIIYVFTGATYKSDANLHFLRENIRQRGPREVILLYRSGVAVAPSEARAVIQDVVKTLFPDLIVNQNSALPNPILGAYVMADSSGAPRFSAVGENQEELPQLLQRLDHDSRAVRDRVFSASLPVVLDGVAEGLREVQMNFEEWNLAQKTLDIVIANSIAQFNKTSPFVNLADELAEAWYNRSGGPRNIALWLARPLRMARGPRTDLEKESLAVSDTNALMDRLITDTVAAVQLAALQGIVLLPRNSPGVEALIQDINEFRAAYQFGPLAGPYVLQKGEQVEIHMVGSPQVQAALQQHFKRDWSDVISQVDGEAHEKLADLTIRLQANYRNDLAKHPIPTQILRGTYVTMSLIPSLVAFTYIVSNEVPWTDIRIPAAVLSSHFFARFFMYLDEKSMVREWRRQAQIWYTNQQRPRLQDILHNFLALPDQFRPAADRADLDRLQLAVDILSHKPMQLDLQATP